ncbi:MerR family transcriptional regulator [Streptomyces sp. XM4193]|uniref:MerR family transcriptional regulator n=1 Tax=Streptomyces sp. XM4193 TaxID=2929782 RepID=UPI0035AC242A
MSPDSRAPYRIEGLAQHSGTSVRTIRAYQDRGLLPKPERRGRANVYDDSHLSRLRRISALLERGFTLASIKELLGAWDSGVGLAGVLGLVAEVDGPWSTESPTVVTRAELAERFGAAGRETSRPAAPVGEPSEREPEHGGPQGWRSGAVGVSGEETPEEGRVEAPEEGELDDEALAEAVELGVLMPVPGKTGVYHVPSPQELAVATELHAAGVPLGAVTGHLRELRGQIEHIAGRFLDLTNAHVFARYLDHTPSDHEVTEAADLVRRLRPLAQQTVEAELARAMSQLASEQLRHHLSVLPLTGESVPRPTAGARPFPRSDSSPLKAGRGGAGTAETAAAAGSGPTAPQHGTSDVGPVLATAPDCCATPGLPGEPDTPAGSSRPTGPTGSAGTAGSAEPTGPAASAVPAAPAVSVSLPEATVSAVRQLVGGEEAGAEERLSAFITAAAEREVQARTLDRLSRRPAETATGLPANEGREPGS